MIILPPTVEGHQPAMVHQRFNIHFPALSRQKASLVALQQLKILTVNFTDVLFCRADCPF